MSTNLTLWSRDGRYKREYIINRCLGKSNILLASWNADIKNDAGLASVPARDKKITNEYCMKLCTLPKNMDVQVKENDGDTNTAGYGLKGSFVEEADMKNMNDSEWEGMAQNWIDIEEDPSIEEDDLDDAYDEMERDLALMHDKDEDEDLPPPNEEQITITCLITNEGLATLRQYCQQQKVESRLSNDRVQLNMSTFSTRALSLGNHGTCTLIDQPIFHSF